MGRTYTNLPIDFQEQLSKLKSYGLLVKDEDSAIRDLHSISYFRLVCYLKFFEVTDHCYQEGTTFDDGLSLYQFDNCLKSIIFKAIQNIEVALRTRIIHYISLSKGAFWFMDVANFKDAAMFQKNLDKLNSELERSNEDFLSEHRAAYSDPSMPPAWKTLEVASFGTLSKIYESLDTTTAKKQVALSFGLPQYTYLESWNRCAVILRNCCAHHARVWNRRFAVKPQLPQRLPNAWISNASTIKSNKLYAQLCTLAYMEQTITPNAMFKSDIKKLFNLTPNINLKSMGFPANWQDELLWK